MNILARKKKILQKEQKHY